MLKFILLCIIPLFVLAVAIMAGVALHASDKNLPSAAMITMALLIVALFCADAVVGYKKS